MRSRGMNAIAAHSPEGREALRAFRAQLKGGRGSQGTKQYADFEALLDFQMRTSSLPVFTRQFLFVPGRRFAADFAQEKFRLLIEVQGGIWRRGGGAHSHPSNIQRDVEKHQLAVLSGWHLFPVTTDEVKNGQALKLIELALQQLGWNK